MMDDAPDFIAQFDQMLSFQTNIAQLLHTHYVAELNAGFTEVQAFELTLNYQRCLATGGSE